MPRQNGIESDKDGFYAYWGESLATRRETLRNRDVTTIKCYQIQGNCHGSDNHFKSCPQCEKLVAEFIDSVPDCFEVADWVAENHPDIAEATRYLSPEPQYEFHLSVWYNAGMPECRD